MILFTNQSRFWVFFPHSTLHSFLKELLNMILLTQDYHPAGDCKIHFCCHYPKVAFPTLSSTKLLFNIWLFLALGSFLVHKNWNFINYQYLFDVFFLTIKAQAAPWPILKVSFLHLDSNKCCNLAWTWVPNLAEHFCNPYLIISDELVFLGDIRIFTSHILRQSQLK